MVCQARVEQGLNTDQFIMQRLLGRLWHVTSLERFEGIKYDGFVRHIGGFSLFDFPIGFDLASYRQRCPSSSLEAFIPYRREWGHAVWLEIDEERQREAFLPRGDGFGLAASARASDDAVCRTSRAHT